MPALRELLLQEHGDLLVDLVAGVDDVVERQVGRAGVGQHLLGLLRVVGALQVVGVVIERALRDVGIGDLAEAEGHGVDDRLLVDRHVERLAHLLLCQRARARG